jgi:hypothetical protein
MTDSLRLLMRNALLATLIGLNVTACAVGEKPRPSLSAPERVTDMAFSLSPDNFEHSASAGQLRELAGTISGNLKSLGYPVSPAPAGRHGPAYRLEARIGKPEKQATPAGLSFNFGNSDPRALDFQKANVLPVTCLLRPPDPAGKPVKLTAGYSLPADVDALLGTPEKPVPADFYVDRIGTVCLNLLAELKIPKAAPAGPAPAWVPSVNIEIRDKPEAPAPAAPTVPAAQAVPAAPAPAAPAKAGGAASAPPPPAETPAGNPVTTESRVNPEDRRKQLIIHNMGTPLILEFGYERQ